MKLNKLLLVTCVFILFGNNAIADTSMHNHQEKMMKNIDEMQNVISLMEKENDGWKIRELMKQHTEMMNVAIKLSNDMILENRRQNEKCIEEEKSLAAGDETCYPGETHHQTQQRLIVTLLTHVVDRQNIILDKMGLTSKHKTLNVK